MFARPAVKPAWIRERDWIGKQFMRGCQGNVSILPRRHFFKHARDGKHFETAPRGFQNVGKQMLGFRTADAPQHVEQAKTEGRRNERLAAAAIADELDVFIACKKVADHGHRVGPELSEAFKVEDELSCRLSLRSAEAKFFKALHDFGSRVSAGDRGFSRSDWRLDDDR